MFLLKKKPGHPAPFWSPEGQSFFVLCILAGIALRVYLAYATTFWLDELWSSYFSDPAHSLRQVIEFTVADVHPPLYQILLHYWFMLFGFTEASGRSLSLLFGLMAMPCFYWLATTIYARKTAHVAMMIFALSPSAAAFSAEVRSYELLLLLSIASTACFAAYIVRKNNAFLIAYLLSGLAAVYTHYFGLIVLFTHGITLLLLMWRGEETKVFWRLLLVYVLMLVFFLPMLDAVINNVGRETFWIRNPGLLELISYVPIYFGGPFAIPLFVVFGIILFKGNSRPGFREYLLILAVFLILFMPYMAGFFINPVITVRNTIIAVPYWCLLLAYPVAMASEKLRLLFLWMCMGIVVLGFVLIPVYKGENIDDLLMAVADSGQPIYMVNSSYLATDIFLHTKIAMNKDRYKDIRLSVLEKDMVIKEPVFWIACYHTCNKISLEDYMHPGYAVTQTVTGKGIKGLLVEKH